jgi:PAS domain S-box-containing protein
MPNEGSYRDLFELAADAMYILDKNRRIKEINHSAYTQVGYSRDELIGRDIREIMSPEFVAMQDSRFNLMKNRGYLIYESALLHKDGSKLPIEVCSRQITWQGESAFFGVVRDISERKQHELQIQKSEEKWRALFDNMINGFALHDVICDEQGKVVDYRFLEVNRSYEQLTGLKGSDLIGRTVLEVLPGTEPYWIEVFGRVAQTGEPTSYENYSKELGRWYQVRAYSPTRGQFAVIVNEITERILIEQSLKKSEGDLRQAQAIAQIGSWTHDMEGRIFWSDECYRIFGFSPETYTPSRQELYKLVHPDDVPAMQAWNELCSSGQDPGPLEWRCIRPDGSIRYILGHGTLVMDDEGKPSHMAGTVQDITERKATEDELLKYREHLEELVKERTVALEISNKELESYSYSIAHDLRAPLRSISGYCQIVLADAGDKLDSIDKKHLQRVIQSAAHMAQLIDDILELSRVVRTDVKFDKVNLNDICWEIVKTLRVSNPDRKLEWRIQSGMVVHGDYRLLYIVMSNLLGNAWKFTQHQSSALIEFGSMDQKGEKVFYVRDNGVGFDMKHADKLFGLFQRLHRPDEFEGTGVGLATVQRIINRHNGWVKIKGETGKGTTVYFSIPETNNFDDQKAGE